MHEGPSPKKAVLLRRFVSERVDAASSAEPDYFLRYLADHDVHCPDCRFNLRGNRTRACPECGREVDMSIVGLGEPLGPPPWKLFVLSPWCLLGLPGLALSVWIARYSLTMGAIFFGVVAAGCASVWLLTGAIIAVPNLPCFDPSRTTSSPGGAPPETAPEPPADLRARATQFVSRPQNQSPR